MGLIMKLFKPNKKIVALICSIFTIIIILMNSTYSLLFKTDETDLQSYTTGVLTITSSAVNNSVTLTNALPMEDSAGEVSTPYTFRITNEGTVAFRFDVKLLSTSTENQIDPQYIKIKVNDDELTTLKDLTDGIILEQVTLEAGNNIDVELRVWLDINTPNTQIGKVFNAKILTEGQAVYTGSPDGGSWGTTSIDNSGANAPAYTEGLIPVMYDETTNKWVKADTTSSTSEYAWYDYNNKKWANAVLVKNNVSVKEEDKNVNVNIPMSTSYTGNFASFQAAYNYTYDSLKMNFATGSSGGIFSFDYSNYLSEWYEGGYGNLEIFLNGEKTIFGDSDYDCADDQGWMGLDCNINKTFSVSLEPNTKYNVEFKFVLGDGAYAAPVISNISLPDDLTESLGVYSGACIEDFGDGEIYYCGDTWVGNNSSATFYSEYAIDDEMNFVFDSKNKVLAEGSAAIGNYMCSEGTTKCTGVSKVKEVSNNKITKVVDIYKAESDGREILESSEAGTEIPEDIILAYYVWIPRFKYKLFNAEKTTGVDWYDAFSTGIDIEFEKGTKTTGKVSCNISSIGVETCENAVNGNYYTHPAFTFGEDELTGFWIGKYELSHKDATFDGVNDGGYYSGVDKDPRILPGKGIWSGNNVLNNYTVIRNMQSSGNIYGLSSDMKAVDSHMLKNIEYGALAYLTHSNYGRCSGDSCDALVNSSLYFLDPEVTGNSYTTTTGNIYGVYDIANASYELVMANMIYLDGKTMISGNSASYNSGFNGILYNSGSYTTKTNGVDYPNSKYYDMYPYSTSSDYVGHLGDATSEVKDWTVEFYDWYEDKMVESNYISYSSPWFVRGGVENAMNGWDAGVFDFTSHYGRGAGYTSSTRAILAVFPE